MFKKFTTEDIGSSNILKSSAQRAMKKSLMDQFASVSEEMIEEMLPKKANIVATKCTDRLVLYSIENTGEPLFFQHYDGAFVPTLRLLHKYPTILPSVQVDQGAIRSIMNGADVMAPGLTSADSRLPMDLKPDTIVSILGKDKENIFALGILVMGVDEILRENQGRAIENVHFLNDGLWKIKKIEH